MIVKNEIELILLRRGGKILAAAMAEMIKAIKPGVSSLSLDKIAEKFIVANGGRPSFKNYGKKILFPATVCVSLNEEVVHGVPVKNRILREGDIVSLDVGMQYPAVGGFYTDMARTIGVGRISPMAEKLIKVTEKALKIYFKKIKAEKDWNEIVRPVQDFVEKNGFSLVRSYVGHGVGASVHEDPPLPNYVSRDYKLKLKKGLASALEPMVCQGDYAVEIADNGWTVKTVDRKIAAHFEDTVVVNEKNCEIITR